MNDKVKKVKSLMAFLKNRKTESSDHSEVLKSLQELKTLMTDLILQFQLTQIQASIKSIHFPSSKTDPKTEEAPLSLPQALDSLEEITTTKLDADGSRFFLLHRLTKDFEYKNSETPYEHETKDDTKWRAEIGVSQLQQERSEATLKGANPVISCYIPEKAIKYIKGAQENTGTWNELGANPHKNKYIIVVKPGKYELYQELKQ